MRITLLGLLVVLGTLLLVVYAIDVHQKQKTLDGSAGNEKSVLPNGPSFPPNAT
jgi:hypothetical protein